MSHGTLADQPETFGRIGVPLVGLFPFLQLFIVTSVDAARTQLGDARAADGRPTRQARSARRLDTPANAPTVVALAVANALLGMSLGLLASAFARTEFQAVQFMPAFILPQLLLCGLFVPREHMAGALRALADAVPATYAYDALHQLADNGALGSRGTADLAVILGITALALIFSAATLRRRTA